MKIMFLQRYWHYRTGLFLLLVFAASPVVQAQPNLSSYLYGVPANPEPKTALCQEPSDDVYSLYGGDVEKAKMDAFWQQAKKNQTYGDLDKHYDGGSSHRTVVAMEQEYSMVTGILNCSMDPQEQDEDLRNWFRLVYSNAQQTNAQKSFIGQLIERIKGSTQTAGNRFGKTYQGTDFGFNGFTLGFDTWQDESMAKAAQRIHDSYPDTDPLPGRVKVNGCLGFLSELCQTALQGMQIWHQKQMYTVYAKSDGGIYDGISMKMSSQGRGGAQLNTQDVAQAIEGSDEANEIAEHEEQDVTTTTDLETSLTQGSEGAKESSGPSVNQEDVDKTDHFFETEGRKKQVCQGDTPAWKAIYTANIGLAAMADIRKLSFGAYAGQKAAMMAALGAGFSNEEPIFLPPGSMYTLDQYGKPSKNAPALGPKITPSGQDDPILDLQMEVVVADSVRERQQKLAGYGRDPVSDWAVNAGAGPYRIKLTARYGEEKHYQRKDPKTGQTTTVTEVTWHRVGEHVFDAPLVWARRLLAGPLSDAYLEFLSTPCDYRYKAGKFNLRTKSGRLRWMFQFQIAEADSWLRVLPLIRGQKSDFTTYCPNQLSAKSSVAPASGYVVVKDEFSHNALTPQGKQYLKERARVDRRFMIACQRQVAYGKQFKPHVKVTLSQWQRLIQYDMLYRSAFISELRALHGLLSPDMGQKLEFNRKLDLNLGALRLMIVFRKLDVDVSKLFTLLLDTQLAAIKKMFRNPIRYLPSIAALATFWSVPGLQSAICSIPEFYRTFNPKSFQQERAKPEFLADVCSILYRLQRDVLQEVFTKGTDQLFEIIQLQGFVSLIMPAANGARAIRILLPDLYSEAYPKLFRNLMLAAVTKQLPMDPNLKEIIGEQFDEEEQLQSMFQNTGGGEIPTNDFFASSMSSWQDVADPDDLKDSMEDQLAGKLPSLGKMELLIMQLMSPQNASAIFGPQYVMQTFSEKASKVKTNAIGFCFNQMGEDKAIAAYFSQYLLSPVIAQKPLPETYSFQNKQWQDIFTGLFYKRFENKAQQAQNALAQAQEDIGRGLADLRDFAGQWGIEGQGIPQTGVGLDQLTTTIAQYTGKVRFYVNETKDGWALVAKGMKKKSEKTENNWVPLTIFEYFQKPNCPQTTISTQMRN